MRAAVAASLLLLGACATYTPHPLASADSASTPAVDSVLEQKAGAIERPWLEPVTVDLSAPLTPEAIAALAVANNPDLAALRAREGVSEAQVYAAGLLPDPTFSIGANKVLSGPDTLLDVAGGLGLDLNALRTHAVRREAAVAQAKQVRLDLAWAEWQAAGQARIEAARVVRLERIAALAQTSRDQAHSLLERISRATLRGDLAGDRLQAARVATLAADQSLRTSQNDLATARASLRHLLGLSPDFPLQLAPPAARQTAPPPADALFLLAKQNRTDLAALRAGYAAQEAAVHKAVLDQFPNLALTINGQRDSAGNRLLGPALDFTLPLWNRNRGGIAVERATRTALRAEYDARLAQTRADIAAAEAGIALAMKRRSDAQSGMAQAEQFATASRQAAERGDLSLETAENAEQALRDRQMELAGAERDYTDQMIALELLTGTPMDAWPQ